MQKVERFHTNPKKRDRSWFLDIYMPYLWLSYANALLENEIAQMPRKQEERVGYNISIQYEFHFKFKLHPQSQEQDLG